MKMRKKKQRKWSNILFFVIGVAIAAVLIQTFTVKSTSESKSDLTAASDEIKTLSDGTKYIVHPDELLSGGPPKDGIPPIDKPEFISAEEAGWLQDDDLVLGLDRNSFAKAYPHRIMNWHEIVNDFAGDEPVLVTYCPLCRSGVAFRPVINGERVTFGTSGKLYNSDLVMYDRKTDSYWSQVLGKAIVGELTGTVLEQIPLDTARWKDWKEMHPDTLVLSKDTGFLRDYDRNPYSGYQTSNDVGFGVTFTDTRLHPKSIVYGVVINDKAKAYEENSVKNAKTINDEVNGNKIRVEWDEDLQTVKIFDADNNRVSSFGHFWFAWAAFYPETELYK